MRHDEPFPILFHEGHQVRSLIRRQFDLAHTEEENRVEVAEISRKETLAGRNACIGAKSDGLLRDRLRVGSDERIERARLVTQSLDRWESSTEHRVLRTRDTTV